MVKMAAEVVKMLKAGGKALVVREEMMVTQKELTVVMES